MRECYLFVGAGAGDPALAVRPAYGLVHEETS